MQWNYNLEDLPYGEQVWLACSNGAVLQASLLKSMRESMLKYGDIEAWQYVVTPQHPRFLSEPSP